MSEQTSEQPVDKGRPINPLLKSVLEYGPVVLFFIAYLRLKDQAFEIGGTSYEGFIVVTAGFVPLMVLSTLALWKLTGKLSKMQVMTLVLIVVFGGLSVWFNDERFFKMKPTMIYLLFGGLLGIGLMRGQSWLKVVMEEVMGCFRENVADASDRAKSIGSWAKVSNFTKLFERDTAFL